MDRRVLAASKSMKGISAVIQVKIAKCCLYFLRRAVGAGVLLSLASCATPPTRVSEPVPRVYRVPESAFSTANETYVPHPAYVAINIPYENWPVLLGLVQKDFAVTLQNRGEAHVTVITPPEFDHLKTKLKMADIDTLALEMKIAHAPVQPVCLGRGHARLLDSDEATFYVVVRAPELVAFRQKVAQLYQKRGGAARDFVAEHFYSHITLGFTKVDLHEQNGVIKDEKSCVGRLEVMRAVQ